MPNWPIIPAIFRVTVEADGAPIEGAVSSTDPGALGAGKVWINPSGPTFAVRDATNTNWLTLSSGIRWLGAWNALTDYVQGDAVSDGGITYLALAPNTNDEPPSANWEAIGSVATEDLATTLGVGNDANALTIVNLADPVNPQDADTQAARDAAIAAAPTPNLHAVLLSGEDAQGSDIVNFGALQGKDSNSYIDTNGGYITSSGGNIEANGGELVAAKLGFPGLDANNSYTVFNLPDPINPQDADTQAARDAAIAANAPTLAAVLAASNDANDLDITNIAGITGSGDGDWDNHNANIRGFRFYGHTVSASSERDSTDLNLYAADGGPGDDGGNATLQGGRGNDASTIPAELLLEGGKANGDPGRIILVTNNDTGATGQTLVSDGNNKVVFGGIIIAAGVPSGPPDGKLPFAIDTTAVTGGTYYWNGAAWVKNNNIL